MALIVVVAPQTAVSKLPAPAFSPSHWQAVRKGPPYGSVAMSQLVLPVLLHMELTPLAVLPAGLLTYASVRQPTRVLPVQRPAPCGHTQVLVPPGPPFVARLP